MVTYVLAAIFALLSIMFFAGKGRSLFVGHNTAKEPAFDLIKLSKAIGICLIAMTACLVTMALLGATCPEWVCYGLWILMGGDMLAIFIICNLNIIFRKE
ncbi:MAG: DUF3784 domain-containing protein [Lachnospiraceae bacterium]|nr:DUF3784 domain-containing protein [Lachnospiraceae bacterium]